MAELVLTQAEHDEVSQLRCQIELMRREFNRELDEMRQKLSGYEEREMTLRTRIFDLEHPPAGPVNLAIKSSLDDYLDEEQRSTDWVKFEHIRAKLEMSPSQWTAFKKCLMDSYPDEYQEQVRQVPRGKPGRRPMEFRRVLAGN